MRKLIVSNMVTLDGFYEDKNHDLVGLFEHYHPDYHSDEAFDYYNTERIRAADTLILSGRKSFLGNKNYWTSVPDDPDSIMIRREFAQHMANIDKVVVSDKLTPEELAPWENTRIVSVADAPDYIAELKQQPGGEIFLFAGRILWQHLLKYDLIDELHLTYRPIIAGEGVPLFDSQPGIMLKLLHSRTWQGSGDVLACYAVSRAQP